jgi:opacity protein-like surface antigen
MYRHFIALFLGATAMLPVAAHAQADTDSQATGPYIVARAGVGIDADLRLRAVDLAPPTTFSQSADGKRGFTGEIGVGYNVGGFRIEATSSYARNAIDRKTPAKAAAFDAGGSLNKLDFMVNGYVDFIPDGPITPFIGAGVGAARITSRLERTAALTGGTRLNDKDWGFAYQGTAGVAVKVGEKAAIDFSVRHERVSGIRLDGQVGAANVGRSFRSNGYKTTSALVGLRFGF